MDLEKKKESKRWREREEEDGRTGWSGRAALKREREFKKGFGVWF